MTSRQELTRVTRIRLCVISTMWTTLCLVTVANYRVPYLGAALVLAIVLATFIATRRDTWLPFLGASAFPGGLLKPTNPRGSLRMTVDVSTNAKRVVYWAAKPRGGSTPGDAYGDHANGGVVDVIDGVATLTLDCPGSYYIRGAKLDKHVHFREIFDDGIIGPVKSADVVCG